MSSKPLVRALSGVQPSGTLTLGNYLGALKQWIELQAQPDLEALFCIVDLHALTVLPSPSELQIRTLDLMALFLALGLSPERSTLFLQSAVPEHTEMMWLLMSYMAYGDLTRMTQFKDKSSKCKLVNAALLSYPCLMAADILLYQTDRVPVGDDQRQHLEMTRNLAQRVNQHFQRPLFQVPEALILQGGSRIMSLTEPQQKMSKSDSNPNGWIGLLDSEDSIMKKFMGAQTDSLAEIRYNRKAQPGISNLLEIQAALKGSSIEAVERECQGWNYVQLKEAVAQETIRTLKPFQIRYMELRPDEAFLKQIFQWGAERARQMAHESLWSFRAALGILNP